MIIFIILAAVLTFAAALAIAIPLLRSSGDLPQAPWTAMSVIALLVIGAAASYVGLSNWSWPKQDATAAAGVGTPESMVARLVERLKDNPDDLEGWLMLGRSYMVLDQVPLAIRAYERANQLGQEKNPEAMVGLAEALAVQDETQLEGRAGDLIERALELDPTAGKALFYGGAAALRRGDLPKARQRFAALLLLDPPENVKEVIQQQITAIDQQMGGAPAGAGNVAASPQPSAPAVATSPPPPAPNASENTTAANAGPVAVKVTVSLSPKLSADLPASAPLFVFVRDPNQPGPPLAVKRLSNRFPQSVELTAADAMVPGRALTAGQQVQVVARVARSGSPTAQSGDPFGEVSYHVGRDKVVNIVIDRLTP